MTLIYLMIHVILISLAFSASSNARQSSVVGVGGFDLTSTQLIDAFLRKCLHSVAIDLDCQPSNLCQNGAFAQLKSPKHGRPTFTEIIRTHLLAHRHLTDAQHISVLKPKLDFSDLTCYCVPGYTGTYCQIDINECLSNPCSNNSTCVDGINGYECRCPPGYAGEACEIDINECDSSPCSSPGGKCVDLVDGYYCQCAPGYTGPSCAIDIDECNSQPCMHNSTCVDLVNGFECNCTDTGYEGVLCEHNIDDCAHVRCQHGAACIDGINAYECQCHAGYEGRLCEIDLNECESQPCAYGGTCWQNSDPSSYSRRMQVFGDGESSNSAKSGLVNTTRLPPASAASMTSIDVNTFEFDFTRAAGYWCECVPGYTGAQCEIKINECGSSPCGANGDCIDLVNGYKCVCYNGYTGSQCTENIDECTLYSPCASQSKCSDLKPDYAPLTVNRTVDPTSSTPLLPLPYLDGYQCDCTSLNEALFKSSGNRDVVWAGLNCSTQLNACVTLKHMCQHQSECQSVMGPGTTNGSTPDQDIQCSCKPGYTGKYCQYMTTFRMDASYSVAYEINATSLFHLKFDFRVSFFGDRHRMPLVYLKDLRNELVVEIEVTRRWLRMRNPSLFINEYMGFYYAASNADSYEPNAWSTLEIYAIDARSLRLVYSVKQYHLTVSKVIALANRTHLPSKFVLGKRYSLDPMPDSDVIRTSAYTNEPYYLNSACIRDLMLNGEQLFKSETETLNSDDHLMTVKFGCNLNQDVSEKHQCSSDSNSSSSNTKNICLNNSTCVNKWFDYECANCSLPFYGKNCQYESAKLLFLKRVTDIELKSSIEFKPPPQPPNSPPPTEFQISFYLHRISTPETQQQHVNSPLLKPNLAFLLLKPIIKQNVYQYVMSIEGDGYLTLKKVQLTDSTSLDQFVYRSRDNYKLIWTLKNDLVNLNDANTSYSVEVSLKLAEPNLVELAINRTYISRFELVNELVHHWDIDSVKFRNLNQFVYPSPIAPTGFFFHNPTMPSYYQNGFLIYDLQINRVHYVLRTKSTQLIELALLDDHLNFIESFESTVNSVGLFNRTRSDFEIIDGLNQNEIYCDSTSVAQSNYDLINRNRANFTQSSIRHK